MTRRRVLDFTPVELAREGENAKQRYLRGLGVVCGVESFDVDVNIYLPDIKVGLRSFYGGTDGVELYYLNGTVRHSFGVVEWQQNGGYKVIIHTITKALLPKETTLRLPELYNAMFFNALFPLVTAYYQQGIICVRRDELWSPMHIDSKTNAKHFVLVNTPNLVDNPTVTPTSGGPPGRNDHWHQRFVELNRAPNPMTSKPRISKLAARVVSTNVPSVETNFNPDKEVHDIPGDQL